MEISKKRIILGCGTGRCGTFTLARILQRSGVKMTHEMNSKQKLRLEFNVVKEKFLKICEHFERLEGKDVGDSDLVYFRYLELFIEKYPDVKIVCLKRNKEDTIKSFVKKCNGKNWWSKHGYKKWISDVLNYIRFPKYETDNLEEAIGLYWIYYYKEIDRIRKIHPKNILMVKTEVLSYRETQTQIYDFCNIYKQDRVFDKTHYNSS